MRADPLWAEIKLNERTGTLRVVFYRQPSTVGKRKGDTVRAVPLMTSGLLGEPGALEEAATKAEEACGTLGIPCDRVERLGQQVEQKP